jgi:hypothetical protein
MIAMLAKASELTHNHKGFRHIRRQYYLTGIPPHERRFWRVRNKVLWALHCGIKATKAEGTVGR